MRKTIIALCMAFCVGLGLNIGCDDAVELGHQYEIRDCCVVECYTDEDEPEYQWVYIEVSGGEYDGHLYEMRRPVGEQFHAEQCLEIVFSTAYTSDPVDDEPVNIIKPNMV